MPLDERTKAAFAAASESVKQLLTLATASIGGAIALLDNPDVVGVQFGRNACLIDIGLVLLALSVVFGLFALGTLAGQLGSNEIRTPSTYAAPVRFMHSGQLLCF